MSPIPRVAVQVASRRLFSACAPKRQVHPGVMQELQAMFKPSFGVRSQPAAWGKMVKNRAVTLAMYSTGMSTILGWPLVASWALDGKI